MVLLGSPHSAARTDTEFLSRNGQPFHYQDWRPIRACKPCSSVPHRVGEYLVMCGVAKSSRTQPSNTAPALG